MREVGDRNQKPLSLIYTPAHCVPQVFRVYPNAQEFESTRLQETLTAFSDDGKMTVKYGRALRKGEYRVKVYHLDLNKPSETPKLLCETGKRGRSCLMSFFLSLSSFVLSYSSDLPVFAVFENLLLSF